MILTLISALWLYCTFIYIYMLEKIVCSTLKYLLLPALLFLNISNLKAANIVGAEIYTSYLSSKEIKITLFIYTNCNSATNNAKILVTPPNSNSFYVNTVYNSNVGYVGSVNVTPVSPGKCNTCNAACLLYRSIYRLEYDAIVDISKYNGCVFTFSFGNGNRRFSFASNEGLYVETKLNVCFNKTFTTPRFAESPFFHACKDECITTYLTAQSEHNDSLVYEIVSPKKDSVTDFIYPLGYSYKQPLNYNGYPSITDTFIASSCKGFYLDPVTGELNFKAIDTKWDIDDYIALSYMAVKVTQYMPDTFGKMIKASEVNRLMAIMISPCKSNFLPVLSSPKIADTFVCAGSEINLNFITADADGGDKTYIDAAFDIPFATYSQDTSKLKATAKFNWTPAISNLRKKPYTLLITVFDKNGTFTRTNQKLINIYVVSMKPELKFKRTESLCGRYSFSVAGDTGDIKSYDWRVNNIPFSTQKNPDYRTNINGRHIFTLLATNKANCITIFSVDTIEVNGFPVISLGPDIILCDSKSITLNPNPNPNYTYTWQFDSTLSDLSSASQVVSPKASRTYIVEAKNASGCTSVDSINIIIPEFSVKAFGDTTICSGTTVKLFASSTTNVKFSWSPNAGNLDYERDTLYVKPFKTTTYTVTATDRNGCIRKDSVTVRISTTTAYAGNDVIICKNGKGTTLKGSDGYYYSWINTKGDTFSKQAQVFVNPASTEEYYLLTWDSLMCQSSLKKVIVNVAQLPLQIIRDTTICQGDSVMLWAEGGDIYKWDETASLSAPSSNTPVAFPAESTVYTVTVFDTILACSDTKSVNVNVNKDCVWPGDANRDGIVNYLDVLEIGTGFGANGLHRSNSDIKWHSNNVNDWSRQTYNNINYKHLDCNGDGNIDAADNFVIEANYGKTRHSDFKPKASEPANGRKIYFRFSKDTFYAGDLVEASLHLGTDELPILNAYGVAYQYYFYSNRIVPGTYNFQPVCDAVCNQGDFVLQSFRQAYEITEAAIVRTNKQSTAANGKLADISFILEDSTHNYNREGEWLYLKFSNTKLIDQSGKEYLLDAADDSALVLRSKYTVGLNESQSIFSDVLIWPNPATSQVNIQSTKHFFDKVYMVNSLGQVVKTFNFNSSKKQNIDISDLPSGIYFLQVSSEQKMISKSTFIKK